jgi:hypothetical protein
MIKEELLNIFNEYVKFKGGFSEEESDALSNFLIWLNNEVNDKTGVIKINESRR